MNFRPPSLTAVLTFLAVALFCPAVAFAQSAGVDVPAVPDELAGTLWGKIITVIGAVTSVGLAIMKWAPKGTRTYLNMALTALSGVATAIATSAVGASDIEIGISVVTALLSGLGPVLMGIRASKMLNPDEAAAVFRRAR